METAVLRKRPWLCTCLGAAATVVLVCVFGGASATSAAATGAPTRAVADLLDDISGAQVHFLYVVPADGADGQLDTNGQMEQSIVRIERWFVTHAENQGLRVDTYKGVPDITFVRLPHTDAQVGANPGYENNVIGADLVAAGFNNPAKVYAAFYEGHSTARCGGASSAALPNFGAMYLQAWPTGLPRPCRDAPGFGTGTDRPGYFEIALLHEVLHAIGFAPSCAPHVSNDVWRAHVNDSPTDLMYGPDATHTAGWNWSNAVLDFNRDDYYRAHIPGCLDLSDSAYLTPMHLYPLSVVTSGTGGRVTSSPAGTDCGSTCTYAFFEGTQVVLTASPEEGWFFGGWNGACTNPQGTCTVTMNGAKNVVATFFELSLPPPPKPACVVPNVRGKRLARAKKAISRRHCRVGRVTKAYSTGVKAGFVISQRPRAGKHLKNGAKIKLTLSRGRKPQDKHQ